jgi:hypothetical protein
MKNDTTTTEEKTERIIRAAENILNECHYYELPQFDRNGGYGPDSDLGELANALRAAGRYVDPDSMIGIDQ